MSVPGVGIFGFGKMGQIRATVIAESGRGRVLRICDPYAAEFGGNTRVASPEEILGDAGIDVVFICTPNHLNMPLTIAALDAGKHVFCETPFAKDAAAAGRMRDAAQAADRLLQVALLGRVAQSGARLHAAVTYAFLR